MQEALTGLGVHSVLYTTGNLVDTAEARQVELVMRAVAQPHDERAVRTALATDLMGWDGASIDGLLGDAGAWEEQVRRFHDRRDTWERHGFVRMFRELLQAEGVRPRLLSAPGGERSLTNLLHLAEVLHGEEMHRRPGTGGLIQWLATQRDEETPRREEHQLRLESDADAVKVVTIHKSKGLEYPVVFCPFHWGSSRVGKDVYSFHDEADDWQLNVALEAAGDESRRTAEREQLAENIRLLYVSVTRAKNRCYLVTGPINKAETSSLAYILHAPKGDPASAVDETAARIASLDENSLQREMEETAAASGGAIEFSLMPEAAGRVIQPPAGQAGTLAARSFFRSVGRTFEIASFSSLIEAADRGAVEGLAELPDHDGAAPVRTLPEPETPSDIFAFPRGTRAGKCLHAVFERLDFADAGRDRVGSIVRDGLAEYGYEQSWSDTLCDMIARVIEAPLEPEQGIRLTGLARQNCLHELPFTFPLRPLTPVKLGDLFGKAGYAGDGIPERIGSLRFQTVEGFMKGYIDLVFRHGGRFYLVDWKSNHLGNRIENYDAAALAAVMSEDLYVLQYHLYAVALHEYLKGRMAGYDYDRHFGGVFYVFLRGVDPARGPETGIFRDRPRRDLIEDLSEGLVARSQGG